MYSLRLFWSPQPTFKVTQGGSKMACFPVWNTSWFNFISSRLFLFVVKPQFEYFRVDSVRPGIGAEAVLACWFRGHPFTRDPVGVWTKDGQPIPQTSRHSTSAKSRFHTGITAFKLKIANVVQSDYGTYKCNVSNRFGSVSATTKLMGENCPCFMGGGSRSFWWDDAVFTAQVFNPFSA